MSSLIYQEGLKSSTYRSDLGLAVHCNHTVFDCVHVENRSLWIVDHRRPEQRVKNARITNGKVATSEIIHGQPGFSGLEVKS